MTLSWAFVLLGPVWDAIFLSRAAGALSPSRGSQPFRLRAVISDALRHLLIWWIFLLPSSKAEAHRNTGEVEPPPLNLTHQKKQRSPLENTDVVRYFWWWFTSWFMDYICINEGKYIESYTTDERFQPILKFHVGLHYKAIGFTVTHAQPFATLHWKGLFCKILRTPPAKFRWKANLVFVCVILLSTN